MIFQKPDYYDRFRCLAGSCPFTCCGGWDIGIDEASLAFYREQTGSTGVRIQSGISFQSGLFRQRRSRCLLLDEDGLCSIQKEFGLKGLCDSCRVFPRHTEDFPGIREFSLNLSCPECAALILYGMDGCADLPQYLPFSSPEENTADVDCENPEELDAESEEETDPARLAEIFALRETCLHSLAATGESDESIYARIWQLCCSLQSRWVEAASGEASLPFPPSESGWAMRYRCQAALFDELDVVDPSWPAFLRSLLQASDPLWEDVDSPGRNKGDGFLQSLLWSSGVRRRLLSYFLYVYLSGAVYDGDIPGKLRFSLFCAEWTGMLIYAQWARLGERMTRSDAAVIACRLARETEHSDSNIAFLEEEGG